jgi:hypothetical protein
MIARLISFTPVVFGQFDCGLPIRKGTAMRNLRFGTKNAFPKAGRKT